MIETASSFYHIGGTLQRDAPSYVERQADRDLSAALMRGEFCYVLTSRQMGKSSLMVRTAIRLQAQGVAVAVLDLTSIGLNLTPEQWYDGLLRRLDLSDLDHLERHIDWYGSVVAKAPDVWGQARLTQYREDFEKEMAKELGNFNFGLQGSLARLVPANDRVGVEIRREELLARAQLVGVARDLEGLAEHEPPLFHHRWHGQRLAPLPHPPAEQRHPEQHLVLDVAVVDPVVVEHP